MSRSAVAFLLLALVGGIASAEGNVDAIPVLPQPAGSIFAAPQSGPLYSVPTEYQPTPIGVFDAPAAKVPPSEAPHLVRQTSAQGIVSPKIAVLREKEEDLAKLQQEIQQLRFETRTSQQILVKAQMLEFSLTKMRKMGVDLSQPSSGYFSGNDASRMLTTVTPDGPRPFAPPKSKANSNGVSSVVDWMMSNNIAKVLAEPNIFILEGRPAQFHVGGEIPMPAKDSAKIFEYQPFGTQLDVLATCLGDDRVRLQVKMRVSEVGTGNIVEVNGVKCPRLSVRQIDTGIESTFGQPTVLTGMTEERTVTIKVGGLNDFVRGKGSTRQVTNEICLMLVITPERVDSLDVTQRATDAMPK